MDKHLGASVSVWTVSDIRMKYPAMIDSSSCAMPVFALYGVCMKYAGSILIIVLVALGAALYFNANLSWFGELPGDVRIIRPGYSFYMPITTCIIASIIISLRLCLLKVFR